MNSSTAVSARFALGVLLGLLTVDAVGQTWAPTGAPSNNWAAIACSADASKLIAAAGGTTATGQLFTSTNGGTNWSDTAAPSLQWTCVASSADGTRLAAGATGGGLYTSTNSGLTWVSNVVGVAPWHSLACSADGSRIYALSYLQHMIFRSRDGGANWSTNTSPISDPEVIACSADGNTVLMANNGSQVIVSKNALASWSLTNTIFGFHQVTSVSVATDGRQFSAMVFGYSVFPSTNSGANWMSNTLPANSSWNVVVMSADGTQRTALGQKGIIYSSADAGAIWVSNSAPGLLWQGAASSADGSAVFAVASNGGIWSRRSMPSPMLKFTLGGGSANLAWTVPTAPFSLRQSSSLFPPNWIGVNVTPVFDPTNLQYALSLPLSNGSAFYHLESR